MAYMNHRPTPRQLAELAEANRRAENSAQQWSRVEESSRRSKILKETEEAERELYYARLSQQPPAATNRFLQGAGEVPRSQSMQRWVRNQSMNRSQSVDPITEHNASRNPPASRKTKKSIMEKAKSLDSQRLPPEEPSDGRLQCVICQCVEKNTMLNPCHHISCCDTCYKTLDEKSKSEGKKTLCPICRSDVTSTVKVHL